MQKVSYHTVLFLLLLSRPSIAELRPIRLMVVSSYHRAYLWEQDIQLGIAAGLRDFKFLDSDEEVEAYAQNDAVEGKHTVVHHLWMDAKRQNSRSQLANRAAAVLKEIQTFKPDLLLLGDDTAAELIGTQFLDSKTPIVFYGMDATPLKYGLVDSVARPGHNATGTYQEFYFKEGLTYLKELVPKAKTFAVLSDDSAAGRAKFKTIREHSEHGQLPLKLGPVVMTNSFSEWKAGALKAAATVDSFVMLNHNTLKDNQGQPVDQMEAGAWYLKTILKPDVGSEKQFVQEGILLSVDDSGFKQSYEALRIVSQILFEHRPPASIPIRAPVRGKVFANRERASALDIDLLHASFIEEQIDEALALHPKKE